MGDQSKPEPGKPKSVLDGIPVKEGASLLGLGLKGLGKPAKSIVGACKHCGAPIYGYPSLLEGEKPEVAYSCACWRRGGIVSQKMETTKEQGMTKEGK